MNGHRHARGFTLIEMVVAIVIFMLFVTAVYGVYSAANMAIMRVDEQEEIFQTGRVLLEQINTELTSAYQASTATVSSLTGEDTDGASDAPQQDTLTFLTTAHAAYGDAPAGDVSQVIYEMGGDTPDDTPGLYVEENFHPGLETPEETPARRLLSPLVVGFNCKYLPAGADWLTEWVGQSTLPVAVRVELTLRPPREDAIPIVLVTTANLMLATVPAGGGNNAPP